MARSSLVLVAGDLVCFLLFAVIGLRSHEEGLTVGSLLRAFAPFAAAWEVSARLTGAHRPAPSAREAARDVLLAWGPAWVVGLAVRSLIFGRSLFSAFGVIALLFNGALLLAWRLAALTLLGRDAAAAGTRRSRADQAGR